LLFLFFFFFSSRRRHTRFSRDWSSDVCSSDLMAAFAQNYTIVIHGGAGNIDPQMPETLQKEYFEALDSALSIGATVLTRGGSARSEERRVGKECRSRRWQDHSRKNDKSKRTIE